MDIWAVGVIMADLFKYICGNQTSSTSFGSIVEPKRPTLQIFKGSHCFPLSPKKVQFEADGLPATKGDVLESIFDLIGTPTETDIAFVSDQQAAGYIRKFTPRPRAELASIFPIVSKEGHHLLTQMLQFNPYLRPNVEQCLASPYFDRVRSFSKVVNASQQVEMAIEELTYLSLKEIRAEFNKIVNYYEDSKSLNSSDLSVNPISAQRQKD